MAKVADIEPLEGDKL